MTNETENITPEEMEKARLIAEDLEVNSYVEREQLKAKGYYTEDDYEFPIWGSDRF